MKKILALIMAGTLFVTSSVCAFAATSGGSNSRSAEDVLKEQIKTMQDEINKQNDLITKQTAQIQDLVKAVQASNAKYYQPQVVYQSNGRGSSTTDSRTQALIKNNAVTYGSNTISQGGHVEINGGKSNVTFLIGAPDSGTLNSANSLAVSVSGTLLNCVTVGSGVAFKTAKVNFYMKGVTNNDNIAVYQMQGGNWVQIPTAEIRQDHVVVNMTQTGTLAFIRVPVLASATH